jgi:hypothetical protein
MADSTEANACKAICDAIAPFRRVLSLGTPVSPEFLRAIFAALVPAVTLPTGEALLGNKARSEMYNARDAGRLKFVKDGNKTLIVTESIFEYQKNSFLPFDAAKSKMPPPSKARQRKSRKQGPIGGGADAA